MDVLWDCNKCLTPYLYHELLRIDLVDAGSRWDDFIATPCPQVLLCANCVEAFGRFMREMVTA